VIARNNIPHIMHRHLVRCTTSGLICERLPYISEPVPHVAVSHGFGIHAVAAQVEIESKI